MQSTCGKWYIRRNANIFTFNLPEIIKHIVASNAWLKESKNKKKRYLNRYSTRSCDTFQSNYQVFKMNVVGLCAVYFKIT